MFSIPEFKVKMFVNVSGKDKLDKKVSDYLLITKRR